MLYIFALTDSLKDLSTTLDMACVICISLPYLITKALVLFNHAPSIRDTGFLTKKGVSLHKFNSFPFICVAIHPFPSFSMCRVQG